MSAPHARRRVVEAAEGRVPVAEADIRPQLTNQVAAVLGRQYGKLQDPRLLGASLLLRWPACLAAAMAGVAATGYQGGTYWPVLRNRRVSGALCGISAYRGKHLTKLSGAWRWLPFPTCLFPSSAGMAPTGRKDRR